MDSMPNSPGPSSGGSIEDNAMRPRHKRFTPILLALSWLIAPTLGLAQEEPGPLAEIWIFTPKEDQRTEFFEGFEKHVKFRSEHGDPRAWQSYTPLLGDKLGRLAVRHCCANWADVDSYRQWDEDNEMVNDHYEAHVADHVEKVEHYFETLDWAHSHWSDAGGPFKYFAVTEFSILPGHGADFDEARDKMSQIAINQGWATDDRSWLWAKNVGGAATETIIIPHRNFASMASNRETFYDFLSRMMGSADAASELMRQFSGSIAASDFQIWEHHKNLSMDSEN
jgi:hypothetical protein